MSRRPEEFICVFGSERWRADDSDYLIAVADDGTTIKGDSEPGRLIPGLSYRFFGTWGNHPTYGKEFSFTAYVQHQPHTREGCVRYLLANTANVGIGRRTAEQIFDLFGPECVKMLRTDPESVAARIPRLKVASARNAASSLSEIAHFEEARLRLVDLFAGRGFPKTAIEECIKKWGSFAPVRIERDPFSLMTAGIPGAGFLRCDRMYIDLGYPPDKLKRQILCCWHAVNTDTSGDTWIDVDVAVSGVKERVSGAKLRPRRALDGAVRSNLLEIKTVDGKEWLALARSATNEHSVADDLERLIEWSPPQKAIKEGSRVATVEGSGEPDPAPDRETVSSDV